jgi:hypothetical protein
LLRGRSAGHPEPPLRAGLADLLLRRARADRKRETIEFSKRRQGRSIGGDLGGVAEPHEVSRGAKNAAGTEAAQ